MEVKILPSHFWRI